MAIWSSEGEAHHGAAERHQLEDVPKVVGELDAPGRLCVVTVFDKGQRKYETEIWYTGLEEVDEISATPAQAGPCLGCAVDGQFSNWPDGG